MSRYKLACTLDVYFNVENNLLVSDTHVKPDHFLQDYKSPFNHE